MALSFLSQIGIEHPLVQAPMAGGPTTPELVAAVCNAGALGSIGAAMLSPAAIRESMAAIRRLTDRPFNVNLFSFEVPAVRQAHVDRSNALLAPLRAELGLPAPPPPTKVCEPFHDQVAAVIEAAPRVVSFAFGIPEARTLERIRRAGSLIVGSATTVQEALAWQGAGADAVVAQGAEAGGHRGTFLHPFGEAMVEMRTLVASMVKAIDRPVLAAGGMMDGRDMAAALALGAQACQLGTAFLTCPEAGTSPLWRARLLALENDESCITRAFTGRPARGLRNRFTELVAPREDEVAPYPVQIALASDIRAAAVAAGRADLIAMWAGQGAARCRALPAAELVRTLMEEMKA